MLHAMHAASACSAAVETAHGNCIDTGYNITGGVVDTKYL